MGLLFGEKSHWEGQQEYRPAFHKGKVVIRGGRGRFACTSNGFNDLAVAFLVLSRLEGSCSLAQQ
jgi:hypothetical protein